MKIYEVWQQTKAGVSLKMCKIDNPRKVLEVLGSVNQKINYIINYAK